jgi:predicted ABC-type sugar transport system permease subunit
MLLADFTASDAAYLALAVFLIAVGLTLAYAFIWLALTLQRTTHLLATTEEEVIPVVRKAGGTLDRVNAQLDKADVATTSAVDAVLAVDKMVRAVSGLVTVPVQKLAGLVAGVRFGTSNLRTHHDVGDAVRVGKEAAARREQDLAEELRREGDSH